MWWMTAVAIAGTPPRVHVDRQDRVVYILDQKGTVTHQEPIGVGRGGLTEKFTMSDYVTPTGTFTVDLVLEESAEHNDIEAGLRTRWARHAIYGPLLDPADRLTTLYANMASLDFDGDQKPDRAYGVAYVGLDSATAVTGPKLRQYHGTPYWYSIALHGTPDPSNLGQARSGGCVHVSAELLQRLIREGTLAVGQQVRIADGPPASP